MRNENKIVSFERKAVASTSIEPSSPGEISETLPYKKYMDAGEIRGTIESRLEKIRSSTKYFMKRMMNIYIFIPRFTNLRSLLWKQNEVDEMCEMIRNSTLIMRKEKHKLIKLVSTYPTFYARRVFARLVSNKVIDSNEQIKKGLLLPWNRWVKRVIPEKITNIRQNNINLADTILDKVFERTSRIELADIVHKRILDDDSGKLLDSNETLLLIAEETYRNAPHLRTDLLTKSLDYFSVDTTELSRRLLGRDANCPKISLIRDCLSIIPDTNQDVKIKYVTKFLKEFPEEFGEKRRVEASLAIIEGDRLLEDFTKLFLSDNLTEEEKILGYEAKMSTFQLFMKALDDIKVMRDEIIAKVKAGTLDHILSHLVHNETLPNVSQIHKKMINTYLTKLKELVRQKVRLVPFEVESTSSSNEEIQLIKREVDEVEQIDELFDIYTLAKICCVTMRASGIYEDINDTIDRLKWDPWSHQSRLCEALGQTIDLIETVVALASLITNEEAELDVYDFDINKILSAANREETLVTIARYLGDVMSYLSDAIRTVKNNATLKQHYLYAERLRSKLHIIEGPQARTSHEEYSNARKIKAMTEAIIKTRPESISWIYYQVSYSLEGFRAKVGWGEHSINMCLRSMRSSLGYRVKRKINNLTISNHLPQSLIIGRRASNSVPQNLTRTQLTV